MDVARVNCAHSEGAELVELVSRMRRRAELKKRPLAILADLAGPKLRVGRFGGGAVELARGQRFSLTTEAVMGTSDPVSVDYPQLPAEVDPGHLIFLNDGLICLAVREVSDTEVRTEVEEGGWLGDLKGLSVPSAALSLPSLTAKDMADLDTLAGAVIDYVGLSFVRSAADVERLREAVTARGLSPAIVAKIERAQAVSNLDEIARVADAVMVARGDLGVECPIEQVPILQKRIIQICNRIGKPVITATQMLESMVGNPRPTRAEATDVANAVIDGADALMLSAETATGRYPAEAVRMMRRIIEQSEKLALSPALPLSDSAAGSPTGDALARAACLAADSMQAEAIVCLTQGGTTALYLAKWRLSHPILAVTSNSATWRRLSLVWGTDPIFMSDFSADFDRACRDVLETLRRGGRLTARRSVVVTAGLPFAQRGRTNTLRLEEV